MTETKKVNYELEKLNFSKYLTNDVFVKNGRVCNYFSAYEINLLDSKKTEQLNFLNYLKGIKASLEPVKRNKEFIFFLDKKRKEVEEEIHAIQNFRKFSDKLKENQRVRGTHFGETRTKIENLKFDKIKDFERRGRTLIVVKKIDTMLASVARHGMEVRPDVIRTLTVYKNELIQALKGQVDLRRKLDLVRRQAHYEEEVGFYQNFANSLK